MIPVVVIGDTTPLIDYFSWVNTFFQILQWEYTIGAFTFSLMDVFEAGIILSIFGFFIGKIIFGVFNRR